MGAGALFVPAIANAAAGESPRFSGFGVLGDGTSYSEGGAYGSDQSKPTYSPYSVYSKMGDDSLYVQGGDKEFVARKKAILAETRVRLDKLPAYIEKKKWSEVTTELSRYMYETRVPSGDYQPPLSKSKLQKVSLRLLRILKYLL